MVERYSDEFVTWHHRTPIGVKVDEIFGMDSKCGKIWMELARQIYSEQSDSYYRVIEHFESGAPFIPCYNGRISVTHTTHFLAIASLPKTPDIPLEFFNPRTALGIDAEPFDRSQVLKVRSKFLSNHELSMIPEDDLTKNILAWTAKEALYKAALTPGLDLSSKIKLKKLPILVDNPLIAEPNDFGEALIEMPESSGFGIQEMKLFSYASYGCCVTIALSHKSAKFGK